MKTISVLIDENGYSVAAEPIPANAIMTVMTDKEVIVYEEGDELPEEGGKQ